MSFLDKIKKIFGDNRDEIATLHAEVSVGKEFEVWTTSDVGRYLIGRAEQYELDILRELCETDPKDTIKLMRLQTEARMPGKLMQWIEEAIMRGEAAQFQLAQLEERMED